MSSLQITSNGTHIVSGYQSVHVDVKSETPAPQLQSKSVVLDSLFSSITPDEGKDGFSSLSATAPPTLVRKSLSNLPFWIYNGNPAEDYPQPIIIKLKHNGQDSVVLPMNFQWSSDLVTWAPVSSGGVGIPAGSYKFFRACRDGSGETITQFSDLDSYFTFTCDDYQDGEVFVGGNIYSLLTLKDVNSLLRPPAVPEAAFQYLFANSEFIFDYFDYLDVRELSRFAFYRMFYNCSNLRKFEVYFGAGDPSGSDALGHMFEGCTSLRTLKFRSYSNLNTGVCSGILTGTTRGALFVDDPSQVEEEVMPTEGWTIIQN